MKKRKIANILLYCILAAIWGILMASLFVSCNVYEKEEIEIIRCPEIETDTIEIPGWVSISNHSIMDCEFNHTVRPLRLGAALTLQSRSGGCSNLNH